MPKFAHKTPHDDQCLDPRTAASAEEYRKAFASFFAATWAAHDVIQVADDTEHGAIPDGQGGFINPAPILTPAIIVGAKRIRRFLVGCLGGNSVGEIRLGAIIKSIKASSDERINYAWDLFTTAQEFERDDVVGLLQLARTNNLPSADTAANNPARRVEVAEITRTNTQWPVF